MKTKLITFFREYRHFYALTREVKVVSFSQAKPWVRIVYSIGCIWWWIFIGGLVGSIFGQTGLFVGGALGMVVESWSQLRLTREAEKARDEVERLNELYGQHDIDWGCDDGR